MSVVEKLVTEAKEIAAEEEIPQYKAMMLQYIEYNKQENQAVKKKEKLKHKLKARLRSLGKVAELVDIPKQEGRVAVARIYEQREPHVNIDLAKAVLAPEMFNRIFYNIIGERFTVTAMDDDSGKECVANIEEYWDKKAKGEPVAPIEAQPPVVGDE